MKIFFIGGTYEPNELNDLIRKGKPIDDIAACTFQWKFIEGLKEHDEKIILINERRVQVYPKNKCIYYRKSYKKYKQCESYNYAFINLPIIKKISKFIGVVKTLKRCNISQKDVILVYSCHTPYLLGVCLGKKMRGIKKYLIVPDLPQYMNSSMGRIKRILKNIDYRMQMKLIKNIDGFSLITENMVEKLPIDEKKYVVIEGISSRIDDKRNSIKVEKPYILYGGNINAKYGIPCLIEAFKKVEFDGNLVFYGTGPDVELIRNASKIDNRIIYGGLADKKKLFELQEKAILLVNPRSAEDEYTKYSFPSKTIEYMMSGTPILMEKLEGIPESYYRYMYCVENSKVKTWRERLQEIIDLDESEREKKGNAARKFVVCEKNPYEQTKKLLYLIRNEKVDSK